MNLGWFSTLEAVIEADGRSKRAISQAAGVGENYVFQLIKDRKEPGIDHLVRILDILGQDVAFYVITGTRITPEDLELISLVKALPQEAQIDALRFFRSVAASKQVPE